MNLRPLLFSCFALLLPICPARAQLLPDHGTGLEADAHTVALFRFEDPATTAFDSTPNGRNATVSGTTSGTGLFGTGRTFDGVDDRLEFGNVFNALSGSPAWTIEYFAKSADGVYAPHFQNGNPSAAWSFYPIGTGIQYGIKTSASGNDWHVLTSVASPAMDTAWHYYALTWTAGGALSVYRDGVLLGSTNTAGSWGGSNNYGVWMDYDSYWQTYNGAGVVDDIRFSNVARTAEEIQTAYNLATTGDVSAARVPQLINYQGRVAVGTTNFHGTGQFKFALVDRLGTTTYWSNDGTSGIGNEPAAAVSLPVLNGLYSVLLGETTLANMTAIPATVFAHPHVRLRVWFNDGTNGFQLLTPDQRIAAVGYALMAADVPDGTITAAKLAAGAVAAGITDGSITTAKLADGAVNAAKLADGTITAAKLAPGAVAPLDTTGNDPLDLKVNGLRGLRLYDPGDSDDSGTESDGAPNLIGGAPGNTIAAGTVGSTIAGGGATSYYGTAFANSIAADFSFIGGGYGNGIQAGARFGFIGAGRFNGIQTDAIESVINGGINNVIQANAFRSAIVGGEGNVVQTGAIYSTIAGGYLNSISGGYAFVAGGDSNAAGSGSFAAGHRAKATHFGSFVWADSTDADFATTASNQFKVRAGGGAQFETAGAGLRVDGSKVLTESSPIGIAGLSMTANATGGSYTVIIGAATNTVTAGVAGATIAGGGAVLYNGSARPNAVSGDYGTISGGLANTAGAFSTVAGGAGNNAQGGAAVIGGGDSNIANGLYSTVPGGRLNEAVDNSFAAGTRAKARHTGSFVWADSTLGDFATTANNQLLIRASGGVGIGTNAPGAALEVAGQVKITGGSPGAGKVLISDANGLANWGSIQLDLGSVQSTNIATGAVGTAQLGTGAVQSTNIATGAVNSSQLATGAAAANLNAAGQSGVASGGLVLSATENTALVNAGYVRLGTTTTMDSWQQRTNGTVPTERYAHTALWTGSEMIVWGGSNGAYFSDGGRYNPASNSWTAVSTTGAPAARYRHTTVWTGAEMMVWGGSASGTALFDGARYNPASNSWTAMGITDVPAARYLHTAVWTGTEMIIWGGWNDATHLSSGGRYNPLTNTWSAISASGTPAGRSLHTAVWTGSEMIVWGGGNDTLVFANGGRYNPVANTWTAMTTTNAPSGRWEHTAVWTGSEMIVWGGWNNSVMSPDSARYSPATNSWVTVSTADAPAGRRRQTAVWTGTEMIVWGGFVGGAPFTDGGRYNPASNSWTATQTIGAPIGRFDHTAVWTGSEMLVWGGANSTNYLGDGGRYSPLTNSWTAMTTATTPSGRANNTAVWTGTEMLVWGGEAGSSHLLNTGGRYNPTTNSWTTVSTTGAPSGRWLHTAVWSGTEMIVWGGRAGYNDTYLNTGGRYNPATNSWTTTATTNAPTARSGAASVWTGSVMVVWGGSNGTSYFNTGGRYNPTTNSWAATTTTNAPTARTAHTAVWTGTAMINWGGIGAGSTYVNTGGRYNPTADSWSATQTSGAPTARASHTAVWTGTEMIVWGGGQGFLRPRLGQAGAIIPPVTVGRP